MPRVPTGYDIEQTPLSVTKRVVQPAERPDLVASTQQAKAIQELAERTSDTIQEARATKADYALSKDLDALAERYRTDPDWQTAAARATADAEALAHQHGQGLIGVRARTAWAARASQVLTQFRQQEEQTQRVRGVEFARAEILDTQGKLEDLAADPATPAKRFQTQTRSLAALIEGGVRRGLLSPDDAEQMTQQFGERVRQRRAEVQIGEIVEGADADPAATLARMNAGEFDALDAQQRGQYHRVLVRATADEVFQGAIDRALQTGEVTPETDPAIASFWNDIEPQQRAQYIQRVGNAAEVGRLVNSVFGVSQRPLAEIMALSEQIDTSMRLGSDPLAARVLMQAWTRNAAEVAVATNPLVGAARQAYVAAVRAPGAMEGDFYNPVFSQGLVDAARAYMQAQDIAQTNVPERYRRFFTNEDLQQWRARFESWTPHQREEFMKPENLLNYFSAMFDEDPDRAHPYTDRAASELLSFYGGLSQVQMGQRAQGDAAMRAATGDGDLDNARQRILRAAESGDVQGQQSIINGLSRDQQDLLMNDPDFNAQLGQARQRGAQRRSPAR